jgi:hypothetical protein
MRIVAVLIVASLAIAGVPAHAGAGRRQEVPATRPADSQPSPSSQTAAPSVDPARLGVSLDRIRRKLDEAAARTEAGPDAMHLEFRVDVYGEAPKIDLLRDFPLVGPVPYGAPTHQEVVDFLTPKEFRSPVVPFYGMAVWAAQKLWERSRRQRCEEEIAEYRRLVMAGVAVAAPRCTQ